MMKTTQKTAIFDMWVVLNWRCPSPLPQTYGCVAPAINKNALNEAELHKYNHRVKPV
jgi:hypothetical protein